MKVVTKLLIIFIILHLHSYLSIPLVRIKELHAEKCYLINSKNNGSTLGPVFCNKKLPPDSLYLLVLKIFCKSGVNIKARKECSVKPEFKFVPASDNNETFPPDSIFFMETSCKGSLESRRACCVESAARSNPGRQVNLIFTKIVKKSFVKSATLKRLLQYKNVRIWRICLDQYVKGTPIESFFARNDVRKSKYPIEHNADVLRLATLYKYGGVYLDTDVIVTKSFDTLPKNWLAKKSNKNGDTANGILSFSKDEAGKKFTTAALKLLNATFQPHKWTHNGPELLSSVLRQTCSSGKMKEINETACPGLTVFGPQNFYPISLQKWKEYFESDRRNRVWDEPYTYHFWNGLSKKTMITKGSLLAKLAKKFCPRVYKLNKGYFEH